MLVGGQAELAQELFELLGGRFEIVLGTEDDAGIGSRNTQLLLEAIGEAVCLASPDGDVIWGNTVFRELPAELHARLLDLVRLAGEHFRDRVLSGGAAAAESAQARFEATHEPDRRVFDVFIMPVRDEDGPDLTRLAVVARDVSDARRTQQKMDAIDRAGRELSRFDADQIRRMNGMERLQLLESRIVRYTRELLNCDHFAIFLIDRDSGRLRLVISAGLPQEIEDLSLFAETDGSGISGWVAASGRSYICRDADSDERFLPGLSGAKSSLTVPLRVHDRVIGIMDIESREPLAFDERDLQFTEIFARHVAIALHLLNLLVAERSTTNESVSGRVEGELSEPLDDILNEVARIRDTSGQGEGAGEHIARIMKDVEAIRERVRDVAGGAQHLLGVGRAMADRSKDPVLLDKRILVADDEFKIRKVISELVSRRGACVDVFEHGSAAIERLEGAGRGEGEGFDAVLSDIQMPDRNGYEVFSASRKQQPGVPVILMTGFGYDPHHSIVRASQEGLHGVLFKPFEIQLLLQQVRQALGGAPDDAPAGDAGDEAGTQSETAGGD